VDVYTHADHVRVNAAAVVDGVRSDPFRAQNDGSTVMPGEKLQVRDTGHVGAETLADVDLNREGVVRAIGVSNFYPDRLVDLIDHNEVTPAVNQVETHPFFQRTADQKLMRERGVQIESWGPFAESRNDLFTHPVLSDIAEEHGKSVAQVVLRWLIHRNVVVIPKSVRAERMAENFDVFDFEPTDDQMARIASLDTGSSLFFDHRDPAIVGRLGKVRLTD
jgi:2,5-diketo-D-gluconate reductase A